ncbi:Lysophosphatidylcholine acyltransferase 2 [Perkinsus chesapeaki]|uniref:Lysophosphatidylcholine acyltransferase 2 n=1 Tax=Perkinsus chesapeaki TaxID=330153 RepID=A0A7J6MRA7_PERCH|nr:Lysophosphatidylcholine acyltransferase 2 [Perkinsus chesapeaki]
MQEAENRFRVSNDINVRELGDSLWGFLNYPGDLLVMQVHGITPVSTVLKSIAHASRIRDRPIDVVITGAPADAEGAFGGRSRELWVAAVKPEEGGTRVSQPQKAEPIRVGAKTQSTSLAGFLAHRLKDDGVALMQGSSPVTIAKMADAIALAGAHFDGEDGRPLSHLVCRIRTILVEADAPPVQSDHGVDGNVEDGANSDRGHSGRIGVMQLLIKLKEGAFGGLEGEGHAQVDEDGSDAAEVSLDDIDNSK